MARLAAAAAAGVAASIVGAIAVWHLGEALLLGLESARLDPAVAALITGLVGLVVAALIALSVRLILRRGRSAGARPVSGANDVAAEFGGLLARELEATARARPYLSVAISLVAGIAVGAVPELRSLLSGALKR